MQNDANERERIVHYDEEDDVTEDQARKMLEWYRGTLTKGQQ